MVFPITCAANLVGTEQYMKWIYKNPDGIAKVLEVTKEAAVAAENFAFDNGADYYVFAEPTAGPALLRPKFFGKYVQPVILGKIPKADRHETEHLMFDDIIRDARPEPPHVDISPWAGSMYIPVRWRTFCSRIRRWPWPRSSAFRMKKAAKA